jgi:SAM-dependent methyltransferase
MFPIDTSPKAFSFVASSNPYDVVPYKSLPIEWTAPERLALTSRLHGGPKPLLSSYRVLELGCADGANLLPLAYYRRQGTFVGVDGARSQIDVANSRKAALSLGNVEFIHSDFLTAGQQLSGYFDYIIAHGVFSWVAPEVRNALLDLCAEHLLPGGLLYLNYNTRPGWNIRGMVREFLLGQTAGITNLRIQAEMAQEVARKLVVSLEKDENPYSQLMANEFRFICENHVSYVAHEYLAADNYAYWRSEFMALAGGYQLEYVADADFNYTSGRVSEDLPLRLEQEEITGRNPIDTVDFLSYRQLHSPILTKGKRNPHPMNHEEFGNLLIASCLTHIPSNDSSNPMLQHPSGYQVEAKETAILIAMKKLQPLWPRGLRVQEVFPDVGHVMADLRLLHRNGLIELRCIEPSKFGVSGDLLHSLESDWGGSKTTAYHTRETASI